MGPCEWEAKEGQGYRRRRVARLLYLSSELRYTITSSSHIPAVMPVFFLFSLFFYLFIFISCMFVTMESLGEARPPRIVVVRVMKNKVRCER